MSVHPIEWHMAGTDVQENKLAELLAPEGRRLLHRGHETSDLTDRSATATITAWISTQDYAAAGLFRIAPDGAVKGVFDATCPGE